MEFKETNFERLADSIYIAEGGDKATYLYGIKSVHYKDAEEARAICLRTIRNNYTDWKLDPEGKDYLHYLGNVYCPGDPNWIKNVEKIFILRS